MAVQEEFKMSSRFLALEMQDEVLPLGKLPTHSTASATHKTQGKRNPHYWGTSGNSHSHNK